MRLLFFIILFLTFSLFEAQTFNVGDTTCNYVQVDSILRCYQTGMGFWNMTKSYSFDIDGDMINDISLVNSQGGSSPGSSSHHYGVLTCTSGTSVEFVYTNSITSCSSGTMNLISNLSYGSPLNASLNWSTTATNSKIFDFDKNYFYFGNYFCGYVNQYGGMVVNLGFRKILTGDTIYGWLKLKTTFNGTDEILSYAYKHTASNNTVTPVFTNTVPTILCEGTNVQLTANPPGGNFYGLGVSGSTLNTGYISGGGNTNVYYNKGCATAILTISVTPKPIIVFTNANSICYGDSLNLNATPAGGIFGGTGVSGSTFYSSVTGPGTQTVSYYFTDANACSSTKISGINVNSTTTINISSTSTMSCPGTTVGLSANGASTYTWSTGANTSSIVVTPTSTTAYTLTGQSSSGTCPLGITTFTQVASNPIVSIGYNGGPICQGQGHFLYASGNANAYLWSTGSNSTTINVTPSVTTTYSLTGTNPRGCSSTAAITVTVIPLSSVTAYANSLATCVGDTIIITVSGTTQFYINPPGLAVNGSSTVVLSPTASVTYSIFSTAASTCTPTFLLTHLVYQCVGIKELTYREYNFNIFPNPNNGEFEIKGIKEETIFISNELGQLIETKYLSAQNNYSIKINDFQNGVYFVGNKISRQKVVVIK